VQLGPGRSEAEVVFEGGGSERQSLTDVKCILHWEITRCSLFSFLVCHNFVPLHRHDSDVIFERIDFASS